ncbi:MAG: GNAT family N-acetyltransferase [Cyanobacteria bacterium J06626_4]
MEIRKIALDEKVEFWALLKYCLTSGSNDDPITASDVSWITLDEAFAVFIDGTIVSTLRNIIFKQSIRGVLKDMGGIAAVATAPEYRRQGHIKALMKAAFEDMKQKGQVVSALHPFKESFYAAYGYVTTNTWIDVKIPSHSIAHYLDGVRPLDSNWQFERVKAIDVKTEVLSFVTQLKTIPHGLVIDPDRSDEVWQSYHRNSRVVFVKKDGKTQAIAKYTKKGHLETGEIVIREMYWQNLEARDKLFGFFALHQDDCPYIWMRVPFGTNFRAWLRDAMTPFETKIYYRPMMVRVMDVEKAVESLPAPVEGKISFTLQDSYCNWNAGDYQLIAQSGQLKAIRAKDNSRKILMKIEGLSALVYGALSIQEVVHRGWLTGLDEKTTEILGRWFPTTPVYNPYYF